MKASDADLLFWALDQHLTPEDEQTCRALEEIAKYRELHARECETLREITARQASE